MILINFQIPLSHLQRQQLQIMVKEPLQREIRVHLHPESELSIPEQLERLMEKLDVDEEELSREMVLVNFPDQPVYAALALVALKARLGFYPKAVRIRMSMYCIPARSEIAEVVDLQSLYEKISTLSPAAIAD